MDWFCWENLNGIFHGLSYVQIMQNCPLKKSHSIQPIHSSRIIGAFRSHGGTPSYHPAINGIVYSIFHEINHPAIKGYPHYLWKTRAMAPGSWPIHSHHTRGKVRKLLTLMAAPRDSCCSASL